MKLQFDPNQAFQLDAVASVTDLFDRETKGTHDFLKLRTGEAEKVRCGQKHMEAPGVPFAVAVTPDEV